jgi:hypothetical protein
MKAKGRAGHSNIEQDRLAPLESGQSVQLTMLFCPQEKLSSTELKATRRKSNQSCEEGREGSEKDNQQKKLEQEQ